MSYKPNSGLHGGARNQMKPFIIVVLFPLLVFSKDIKGLTPFATTDVKSTERIMAILSFHSEQTRLHTSAHFSIPTGVAIIS